MEVEQDELELEAEPEVEPPRVKVEAEPEGADDRELQLELRSWRSHELDFLLEWADRDADRCVILAKYLECSHGQLT
jgi:hypothetical protein